MIYPAINDLLEKVGSRYALVNVVAKRARELVEGTPVFITTSEKKPVTISTLEVYDGIVGYEPSKHSYEFSTEEDPDFLPEEVGEESQEPLVHEMEGDSLEEKDEE